MPKILVIYYSRSGNTKKMAQEVVEGIKKEGLEAKLAEVTEISVKELKNYEGIIVGSPTYYGQMSWEIKKLFDESVSFHGALSGKVGAAFTSAANIGGGNETTILGILEAMLIHGMIVQGTALKDHYGPVSINDPDERAISQCRDLGKNTALLVKKLFS